MHRSKQLKLFDHFVGAGEQKMRDTDDAALLVAALAFVHRIVADGRDRSALWTSETGGNGVLRGTGARALFFATMGCPGLALTGTAPI
jgi:hypothetical protein